MNLSTVLRRCSCFFFNDLYDGATRNNVEAMNDWKAIRRHTSTVPLSVALRSHTVNMMCGNCVFILYSNYTVHVV